MIHDIDDEMAVLPDWAKPPKGKGVTEKLRGDLLAALSGQALPSSVLRARSWQAIVLSLAAHDLDLAKHAVAEVLEKHRARFSKRYTLR